MPNVLKVRYGRVLRDLCRFFPNSSQSMLNILIFEDKDIIFDVGSGDSRKLYYVKASVLDYVTKFCVTFFELDKVLPPFEWAINAQSGNLHIMFGGCGYWRGTTALLKLPILSEDEYDKRYVENVNPSTKTVDYDTDAAEKEAKKLGWNPANIVTCELNRGIVNRELPIPPAHTL